MLIVQKKPWFGTCASVTSIVTLWFALDGPAYAAVAQQTRERALQLEEVAVRLGFDPDRVRGGAGQDRLEQERIGRGRAGALGRLKRLAAPPAAASSVRDQKAREIKKAHLPDLLAGAARTAEEARRSAHRLGAAKDPEGKRKAARSLGTAGAALQRAMATAEGVDRHGLDARLTDALAMAHRLGQAASQGARGGSLQEVERAAPDQRRGLDTRSRRPTLSVPLSPPRPRMGLRLGNRLPDELREFYASVLDADGIEVETNAGLADPSMLAAGLLPEARLASADLRAGFSSWLAMADGALVPPQPADLAPTPDTRVTPEMQQAVAAAAGSPIALFNFIHDQFEAEPYYGSKKGSVGAWEERTGNDADLSSLLVALLRSAGIPSRYEYGTVDLTPQQAMDWTGTTDPGFAADVLVSTGIPATKILEGAKVLAVRVEHVWVRAYVPYSNYRGEVRPGSRSIWVRLDPTLKRASLRKAVDLRGKVAFDYDGFLSTISGRTPIEVFEQQLRSYVATHGLPCQTLDDAIPFRQTIPDGMSLLPAELPAPVVASLATFSGYPASMRHTVTIGVDSWSVPLGLPEIYGSALTLRYRGSSAADATAIAAAGGISRLGVPSAVQVLPTLVVDGVERGRGSAVLPGLDQELDVSISIPHGGTSLIRHQVSAGSVFAIGFPVGKVPDSVVARREADLAQAVASGATDDELEQARGNRALWRYFWHLDREEPRIFGLQWMRLGRDVSEGIAGRELAADLLFGAPVRVAPGRFTIDVPRYSMRPYGVDGDQSLVKATAEIAGYQSSTREHLIWEETVNVPAISTVRIFQAARQQGLQLLSLDASNASLMAGLPYSDAAREDVANAIHAGLVAKVPERPVSWGRYLQAEGYLLEDPLTGAGDFRIQGTYSGGAADGEAPAAGVGGPSCTLCDVPASSAVSLSLGNMHFSETDLTLPARGIPVAFTRRYDSLSPYGGRLGPGWQHAYEVRLMPDTGGSLLFVNDAFQTERFQANPDGSFTTPAGYHETLSVLADGWRLTFKDGVEYRFRADGQLMAIQDLNDHVVTLRYRTDGRLDTVTDASGRVALTFAYDAGGLLSGVVDATGRIVTFGHTGGDLTSVTDVLGQAESYGYDGGHRLASKTDKNGGTTFEFYDGAGRWIGSQEPDGHGRAAAYDFLNRRAVHTDKAGQETIYEYNERGNPTAVTDALGNLRVMEWDQSYGKLSETDARGAKVAMTYDGAGNLLTRTDATGATSVYTYDGRGRVLTATDPAGKVTTNVYFPNGNLHTTTDVTGATTTYGYTADGLPQTIAQPGGATTTLGYLPDGTVQTLGDAAGGTTTLGYDGYGHLSTITDAVGGVRGLSADAAGRIVTMTDAAGAVTTFEYDAQGNRTAVVDSQGTRTSFGYDIVNRLVSVTDASGSVTRTEYDPEGRVTARVDALKRRTTYRYDAVGRLLEATDAAGATTTQAYCADLGSQACGIVDALGNLTQVNFDALGRPTETVDANGVVTGQHYDALGRRDWSQDGAGHRTSYGYDAAGRLLGVTDPAGGVTGYGYDARGNRTSVTDANGKVTSFGYDLANRLQTETNPLGTVTTYQYDAAGNRRFKTDGNGVTTEYRYDANRRLTKVLFADGTAYDFDYDARGNRTLERSPTHERGLHYDPLGRLDRVEDRTLGRTITYAYDAAGNRERMALDSGEAVQYRWDAAGRLAETTDPQGETTYFGYDAAGRRSRATYGNGTSASYGYDAVGQVLSIVYSDAAGGVQTAFGYGYDAAGNRTFKAQADGSKEVYGYDGLNRLTGVDYPGGRHVEYGYDAVGNRTSLVDTGRAVVTRWPISATASSANPSSGSATGVVGPSDSSSWMPLRTDNQPQWVEVTYGQAERARGLRVHELNKAPSVMRVDLTDDAGQVHTVYEGGDVTASGGWLVLSFTLTPYKVKKARVWTASTYQQGYPAEQIEAVGLDVQAVDTYQYNGFNQLTGIAGSGGTMAFGYDGNGNQVRKTETPAGGAAQVTQYVFNEDNRLTGIALPNGGSNAFEYDANGLRTRKTDSSGTSSYLLDGLSVVAQYAPGGARQALYTQSLARIDEVLNVVNATGKYWYQADALGSVYALTTSTGAVQARGGYDVFGASQAVSGTAVGQPFGFTGREHETDSGLVYARQRYLNPGTGRWDRPDPLTASMRVNGGMAAEPWAGVLAGGMPLPMPGTPAYGYVGQSPDVAYDPTGLAPVIYTGFGGQAIVTNGTYFSVGAVHGFFSQAAGGPGYSSAIAFTYGLGVGLYGFVSIGVGAEFGIYWGLKPFDDACDYAGPFASLAADLTVVGIGLVWSVDPKKLKAIRSSQALLAALEWPVGMTFSAGVSVVPGVAVTYVVTQSHLVNEFNCACR